jgi:isopenicillin N synthase-like dioxygenase
MKLEIINYRNLLDTANIDAHKKLESALLQTGIVGIRDVPEFEEKSRAYVHAARAFSALRDKIKKQYIPDRNTGDMEGYELGAEWFQNQAGEQQIDDKKASYYAFVPDHKRNKWPAEVDLKTPYLQLGELIFQTGKLLLNVMGLNATAGLQHEQLVAKARMLHYHKEGDLTNANPDWCGCHFDHGVFTGLMPAYYFRDDKEIAEPVEAGLHIVPSNGHEYEKINAADKSILLFQVGEFGQLLSNDRIKATKHIVKKAAAGIERFAFALFYNADEKTVIKSDSILSRDTRYTRHQAKDGSISYKKWEDASFERYHARG